MILAALCLTLGANPARAAVETTHTVQQNSRTIRGTVTDKAGETVIGASVRVKGTQIGTITNLDGEFTLEAASGTLLITYIGYKPQEVAIGNRTTFNIVLEEDTELLDEVVITGYMTQKKASLTSAISQVKGDEVFKNRGVSSPTVALQGAVPGLTVTRTSTRPGSEGAAIKIRGDISINGGSPLILIDGVAGSLDELNSMEPADIENISVLKDASAAIYGARSAAGVVLVTTKRGKQGKAQVNYNASFSRTIDGIQAPITNNAEWLDMFYEAQYWDAAANRPDLTTREEIHGAINWWIFGSFGGTSLDDGELYKNEALFNALRQGQVLNINNSGTRERWEPGNYFMDYLYGQANSQKHSISVSGADDKFSYRASLGYSDAQSQLKLAEDGEKKYSGRLNADYQATDDLKFETSMSYEKRDISTPHAGVGEGWMDQWFWAVYNENGDPYDTFNGARNPVAYVKNGGRNNTSFTTFRANAKATYDLSKLVKGLSLSGSAAYKTVEKDYRERREQVYWYDWTGKQMGTKNGPGHLKEEHMKWTNITLGGFANYRNTFAQLHTVEAMLGMTAEQEDYKKISASRNMGPIYPGSGLEDLDVWENGTNNGAGGGQNSWGFVSYLGTLRYNYDQKYLIELLGRRDGSSKLSEAQRWKNFYSLSGGWVLSSESFIKDNAEWLDHLKLRYNYGQLGSVTGINNYERYSTIKTGSYLFGSTMHTTLTIDGMTSDQRTWETIHSHNLGLDFAVLNNRLKGTFEYFVKNNDGMFIDVVYPSVLGTGAPKTNNGKMRAQGWEFELNWNSRVGDFNYYVGGSVADAWSKLLKITNNDLQPHAGKNSKRLIGKPIDALYVYQTDGIFQTQEEVDAYYEMYYWNGDHTGPKVSNNVLPAPASSGTGRLRPGARRVVDLDGDGAITDLDLYYAGDAAPRLSYGLRAGFDWKGIDFQAFFQGIGKQNILRSGYFYAPWAVNYVSQNRTFLGKTWSPDNPNAEYTIMSRDGGFNSWNYANKDISVQDNKYIRLKSLVVGYTLPKAWTAKAGINKLRVYFSGDDLWEWSKVKDGYDPEYGEGSNNTFPFSRLLTFGVDLTF